MNPVEQYIYNQDAEARELLLFVRDIVLKCDSNITEKISYRIPFFSRNKPFCYFNIKQNGIDIGFCGGPFFKHNAYLLELKNRKTIKTYFIPYNSELKIEELTNILTEAVEIDKGFAKKK